MRISQEAYILLPQTTLRLWGIPSLEVRNAFQFKLPIRGKNDNLFEKSYYEMNRMILEMINIKSIYVILTPEGQRIEQLTF
jgi:hypothetical protein